MSFGALLGFDNIDWSEGKATVTLATTENHSNMGGVIHGGALAALLDHVMGASVVTTLKDGEWTATQAFTTDFLRPASPGGVLVATGKVDRRGKLAAFVSGEVVNEKGEVVARATGVWAVRTG